MILYIGYYLAAISTTDLGLPNATPTNSTIDNLLRFFFGLAGGLAVLFIAIGGFKYATSSGDPSATKSAKNTIQYALIGLILTILAQFIIGLVVSAA